MSLLSTFVNLASFCSGVVAGVLICGVALFHFLSAQKSAKNASLHLQPRGDPNAVEDEDDLSFTQIEVEKLNSIIDFLDDVNTPLKSMGSILQRIHLNSQEESGSIDTKMKVIVEVGPLSRMEKEHHDNIAELKDHSKQIKALSSFLHDMGKAFGSFSKDLTKLASTARNNMNKNSLMEKKEDMIVSAWWQVLHQSLEHLASDQEDLSATILEDLHNLSLQIQEEVSMIEKRLSSEGSKHFSALRENILGFETKLRERDKCKEKLRGATVVTSSAAASLLNSSTDHYQKRAQKLKQAEEALVIQTRRLYEVQKDFYGVLPRISSDVQLTMLKSIIETQAQLQKLADAIERAQANSRFVCKKMRLQLTNAAASLVQMIRGESKLLPLEASPMDSNDTSSNANANSGSGSGSNLSPAAAIAASEGKVVMAGNSIALDVMRLKQHERGVQGYELTLQKVLEGLLVQSQLKDTAQNFEQKADETEINAHGKFNMFAESTACLAAANPSVLPELPRNFGQAVGLETSVWFNAISGRLYRDMAESDYFNAWFRAKLAQMLNKGPRPAYIDAFEVPEVKFGDLPPLLLNVKWTPPLSKKRQGDRGMYDEDGHPSARSRAGSNNNSSTNNTNESDDSDNEGASGKGKHGKDASDKTQDEDEDPRYYAACSGDLIFRSGMKFTVATKFWLNWPRDRYASVPVLIHLDLAELQGRVRFGVRRSHSFISFMKDPMMRIAVRSEVGSDRYKLHDIPQVSDLIVRKLKSFIHRKIVHPAAHKTRLIWPRNWWPKGTENLFAAMPVNVPLPGQSPPEEGKEESKQPQSQSQHHHHQQQQQRPAGVEVSVQTESTDIEIGIRSNVLEQGSRSPIILRRLSGVSAPSTTTSAEKAEPPYRRGSVEKETDEAAVSSGRKPSLSSPDERWLRHLYCLNSNGNVTSRALDDRAVVVHFREFYRKHLEAANYLRCGEEDEDHGKGHGNISTFYRIYTQEKPVADRPRQRAMSISDMRSDILEAVLEDVLANQNFSTETEAAATGKLLVGFRRGSKGKMLTEKQQQQQQPEQEQYRRRRATQSEQQHRPAATEDNAETTKWIKARGIEQMEKAKAKFRELKSKHFTDKGNGRKLMEFFFSDESSSATTTAAAAAPAPAAATSGSSGSGAAAAPSLRHLERRSSWAADSRSHDSHDTSNPPPPAREAEDGEGTDGGVKSKAMKYVTSMFRSNSEKESSTHGQSTTPNRSTHGESSSHGGAARENREGSGGQREGTMSSMLSKALSSVRQQMDRDT